MRTFFRITVNAFNFPIGKLHYNHRFIWHIQYSFSFVAKLAFSISSAGMDSKLSA
jgi:hypothetical protein